MAYNSGTRTELPAASFLLPPSHSNLAPYRTLLDAFDAGLLASIFRWCCILADERLRRNRPKGLVLITLSHVCRNWRWVSSPISGSLHRLTPVIDHTFFEFSLGIQYRCVTQHPSQPARPEQGVFWISRLRHLPPRGYKKICHQCTSRLVQSEPPTPNPLH